jgi:hypothetical protein
MDETRGAPRYAEKVSSSRWLIALIGTILVAGTAVPLGLILAQSKAGLEQLAPIMIPAGLLVLLILALVSQFFSLRTAIGGGMLVFGFGLFRKRIHVSRLRSYAPTAYRWQDYGGWGIRWGRDGTTAYNVMGDRGVAVRITVDRDGRARGYLFSSRQPEAVCRALDEELAAAGLPSARL